VLHSLHHLKSLLGRKHLPELHLKLDTGMHRLGIPPGQMPEAIRTLEKLGVKLAGVATHFAESETTISDFTDGQIDLFAHMHAQLAERRLIATDAKIHIGNSGALLRNKLGFSNAVRPGIALYGVSPNPRLPEAEELIPVMEWKTRVLALKDLKRGDTVGYNRTYKTKRRERIALLPIGYADGYPRLLSNRGEVLLAGKRLAVRGRISMDLTAIEATGNPNAREGAMVTLMGKSGKDCISAWELALWAETIPYEILCGISQRVPRVYFD
jgi:alanine racemase